jgi:cholesterol transport system auxiliary component
MMAIPNRARALKSGWILAVALALAACGGSAPETFDLSATSVPPVHKLRAQLAVREPVASLDLDTQRILVRTGPETLAYLAGAQWSDRLPTLVQSRLVQTFQNAHLIQSVARAGAGFAADYSLELDIRNFELDVKAGQARIDIAAKIVATGSGRVVAAQIFQAQAQSAGTAGAEATAALNAALATVMTQIVAFVAAHI